MKKIMASLVAIAAFIIGKMKSTKTQNEKYIF